MNEQSIARITMRPTAGRKTGRCINEMKWLTAAVLVPLAVVFYLAAGAQVVRESKHHDFLNLYTAAHFSRTGALAELYDAGALDGYQRTIAPENGFVVPFARPRFYAVALTPLSLLPYDTAFHAWLVLQSLVLAGVWVWLAWRFGPDALVLAALFYPAAMGIAHGQDSSLVLAVVVLSWAALDRGRDGVAGALAGCLLFKFHLALLLPVALVIQKRWSMLRGFCLAGAALLATELLVAGSSGMAGYVHFLTSGEIPRLNVGEVNMVNVKSLLLNLGSDGLAARIAVSVAVLGLIVIGCAGRRWLTALASASIGAAVLLPHMYQYDLAWTLPALLGLALETRDRLLRLAVFPLLTPFPYLLTLAGPPWAGATSACLLVLLGANARYAWRTRAAVGEQEYATGPGALLEQNA